MGANVEEIYATAIRPLPREDKLRIATLILEEVTGTGTSAQRKRTGGDITKFFGRYQGGDPQGSDNAKIEADLARAYTDNHEEES